jgi:hypothetical protein
MMMLTTVLLLGGRFSEGYCVANDLEQAQGRVFKAIAQIVECSPLLCDAEVTRDRVTFPNFGNATIAAIASDAAGAAGHNSCFSTFDELWGVTSERGRRLWDEMSTSPVRKISGRLTTTYAGYEGESVLLEELYRRGLKQPAIGKDLYAGNGILMFWTHEPVAPWQTQAWLDEQRLSLRPNQYLRQIENRFESRRAHTAPTYSRGPSPAPSPSHNGPRGPDAAAWLRDHCWHDAGHGLTTTRHCQGGCNALVAW